MCLCGFKCVGVWLCVSQACICMWTCVTETQVVKSASWSRKRKERGRNEGDRERERESDREGESVTMCVKELFHLHPRIPGEVFHANPFPGVGYSLIQWDDTHTHTHNLAHFTLLWKPAILPLHTDRYSWTYTHSPVGMTARKWQAAAGGSLRSSSETVVPQRHPLALS